MSYDRPAHMRLYFDAVTALPLPGERMTVDAYEKLRDLLWDDVKAREPQQGEVDGGETPRVGHQRDSGVSGWYVGGTVGRDALPVIEHPAPFVIPEAAYAYATDGALYGALLEPVIFTVEGNLTAFGAALARAVQSGADIAAWLEAHPIERPIDRARRQRVERLMGIRARRAARHGRVLR